MKLKTLKNIDIGWKADEEKRIKQILKTEAIKWVKEDREAYYRLHQDDMGTWDILLNRWMERLNITKEDLK